MPTVQRTQQEVLCKVEALGKVCPNVRERGSTLGSPGDNSEQEGFTEKLDFIQGEESRRLTRVSGGWRVNGKRY